MHFVASLVAVGSIVSLASASVIDIESAELSLLSERQAPGTPRYNCHDNCGGNFTTKLANCLDCALEFDIWKIYGNAVSAAAKQCGVDGTPKPAGNTGGASSSAAPVTTTASSTPVSSIPASSVPTTRPSTSGQPEASPTAPQSSVASSSTTTTTNPAIATAKPTTGPSTTGNNNSTSVAPPVTAAANNQQPALMVAAIFVAACAANMI